MEKIETLANSLANTGMKWAFGISGSGNSYELISRLIDRGINYVPVSHEAVAAIAAGAVSYQSGKLSAAISIKGPGFGNMLSGMSACFFEKYSMISIAEDYSSNVSASKMHKRLRQIEMAQIVCRKVSSLSHLDQLDEFLYFEKGDEAPHHFELAEVLCTEELIHTSPNIITEEGFQKLIQKIEVANKPVLIIGSLIKRLSLEESLRQLRLPVFTTVQAKGILDEALPNSAGVFTGVGGNLSPEKNILKKADLVITIGVRNYEILNPDAKKTYLNLDTFAIPEDPSVLLLTIEQLNQLLFSLSKKGNWANQLIIESYERLDAYARETGWMPGMAFKILSRLPYAHGLVLDTGTFCTVGEHIWLASPDRPFLGSSNGRNMGIAIPTALGMSLSEENKPVFCVMGDGGIRYYPTEVRTFVERKLPVCFVLMTDGQFGSIACNVPDMTYADQILRPSGLSWVKVFEGFGIPSILVESIEDFERAVKDWQGNTPMFIEAKFEREAYLNITQQLRN